jgi:hypothetical protein
MFRRAALIASFLLVSGLANAQAHASSDVVTLKDGTVLRGTVGEMVPNQSVTITVDGQARKVEWKDIDHVDIDIDRAKTPSTPAPPQAVAARTMVHIEGVDDGAFVQMLDRHTAAWNEICRSSCDQELPSDGLYRIRGSGIRASPPFRIEGPRAELHVKTGSSAGFVGGLTLVILGGLSIVNGLSLFLVAAIYESDNLINSGTQRDFNIVGGVLTGVGVGLLVGGAFLFGGNLKTTVAGAPTVRIPAWRDAPQWSVGSRLATFTFPAFAGSF